MVIEGSAGAVRQAAADLGRAGRDLEESGDDVGSTASMLSMQWSGSASDAAHEVIMTLRNRAVTLADEVSACRAVYERYADGLAAAQAAQAAAQVLVDTGEAAQRAAALDADRADGLAPEAPERPAAMTAARDASSRAARVLDAGLSDLAAAIQQEATANENAARQIDAAAQAIEAIDVQGPASPSDEQSPAPSPPAGANARAAWVPAPSSLSWPDTTGSAAAPGVASTIADPDGTTPDDDGGLDPWWQRAWYQTGATAFEARQSVGGFVRSVGGYYRDHPEQLAELMIETGVTALGAQTAVAGVGMEGGGLVLDATGAGAAVGVPANIVGAVAIPAGLAVAGVGATAMSDNLRTMMAEKPSASSTGANPYDDHLDSQRIAGGHAWDKHVVKKGEFPELKTRGEFAGKIEETMRDGEAANLPNGRTAYWKDDMVVFRDPKSPDGGSAFRPDDGYAYFERIKKGAV